MSQINILIVEDDMDINNLLSKIMKKQGYETIQAYSGTEAWLHLKADSHFDLFLLDLMLPGMTGDELIRLIRKQSTAPIIVLSAKSSLEDRVSLLELGADDYIVKPFETEEVLARAKSTLRRAHNYNTGNSSNENVSSQSQLEGAHTLTYKNLRLCPQSREAILKEVPLNLTAHEYDILYLLIENPNKVFSRENMYQTIWQGNYYGEDNTVNVHVSNIRKKIAAIDSEEYIRTVWGIGFKLS